VEQRRWPLAARLQQPNPMRRVAVLERKPAFQIGGFQIHMTDSRRSNRAWCCMICVHQLRFTACAAVSSAAVMVSTVD
jgi:hypothetical protein